LTCGGTKETLDGVDCERSVIPPHQKMQGAQRYLLE
jgi:hypothetical protein